MAKNHLILNRNKTVQLPGPHQILLKSEAVGLCFSDMKLLKQFDHHVRKGRIHSGLSEAILSEMPNYVPDTQPGVPGHEVACTVIAVGDKVKHYQVGNRFIVQADYRFLRTASSNAAFGYNFEGGLQQFFIADERVIGNPETEDSFMIPVSLEIGASMAALVEPWACVENSYVTQERRQSKDEALSNSTTLSSKATEDVVLLEPSVEEVVQAQEKLESCGVLLILLQGKEFGSDVPIDVGRIHYGGMRVVGSTQANTVDAWNMIPETGEIRPNDRVLIMGAGGPMGQMHVIRTLLGFPQVEVVATDTDQERLKSLKNKVEDFASGRVRYALASTLEQDEQFDYIVIMAPIATLVKEAVHRARPRAIINLFAGIPIGTYIELDLDKVIREQIFLFGTSGSEPNDMRLVLEKVLNGQLNTNLSVAAVSGMAGALDGLSAVDNRTLDGKIVVYPNLIEIPLIPLNQMQAFYPQVAAKLDRGRWTKEAEDEFLKLA